MGPHDLTCHYHFNRGATTGVIVCFTVCAALNALLAAEIGVSAFVFGPLSWLVMLGIAALTSFAATYLPVRAAARKKPVESIRAL